MELKRLYKRNEAGNLVDEEGRELHKEWPAERKEQLSSAAKTLGKTVDEVGQMMGLDRVLVDAEGIERDPIITGVRVLHAGSKQLFSTKIVEKGMDQGWISRGKKRITIHGADGDIEYRVLRVPGYYCCHTGRDLGSEKKAKAHIAELYPDTSSPDPNNPSGYRRTLHYECERV